MFFIPNYRLTVLNINNRIIHIWLSIKGYSVSAFRYSFCLVFCWLFGKPPICINYTEWLCVKFGCYGNFRDSFFFLIFSLFFFFIIIFSPVGQLLNDLVNVYLIFVHGCCCCTFSLNKVNSRRTTKPGRYQIALSLTIYLFSLYCSIVICTVYNTSISFYIFLI